MKILYLDCFLALPDEVVAKAYDLNRILVEKFASVISFEAQIEPHITLFMGLFPENQLENVRSEIDIIASANSPLNLDLFQFRMSQDGYIFWDVMVDQPLMDLHQKIVFSLSPLRNGLIRDKFQSSLENFHPEERGNIQKFGFPWVMDLFQPHITLGKLADSNLSLTLPQIFPEVEEFNSFPACRLELGFVGENGVVKPSGDSFRL